MHADANELRWKALMQSNMSHTAMFWVLRFSRVWRTQKDKLTIPHKATNSIRPMFGAFQPIGQLWQLKAFLGPVAIHSEDMSRA